MIVGLLGFIGSGKGTVARTLVQKYNFRQDSFASSLKDACSVIFDWPRDLLEGETEESRIWREQVDGWWSNKLHIENFTPRYALQHIGTDALRNHFNKDIWFYTLENRFRKNSNKNVVVSDVRFPNEIKFIHEQGGILARIIRGPDPDWYQIAIGANHGSVMSKVLMESEFKHIHASEWSWVGAKIDYEINNTDTLEILNSNIDEFAAKII